MFLLRMNKFSSNSFISFSDRIEKGVEKEDPVLDTNYSTCSYKRILDEGKHGSLVDLLTNSISLFTL